MKELWWWSQQEKENECRHQLYHHLATGHHPKRFPGHRFEQPTAYEEETWQTKQEKHSVEAQQGIAQTEVTDMRIDDENHRESPHRIDVFYPLLRHYVCKDTELFTITWIIRRNIVLLSYEREN